MAYLGRTFAFWGMVCLAIVFDFTNFTFQFHALAWFVDIPSFLIVFLPAWFYAVHSTPKHTFRRVRQLLKQDSMECHESEAQAALLFLEIFGRLSLCMGGISILINAIVLFQSVENLSSFINGEFAGPALGVASVALLYGLIGYSLCYAGKKHIESHFLSDHPAPTPAVLPPSNIWRQILKGYLIFMGLFLLLAIASTYEEEDASYVDLGQFDVSLQDGQRLQTTIRLALNQQADSSYVKFRQLELSDRVLWEFQKLSGETLGDLDGSEWQQTILQRLNQELADHPEVAENPSDSTSFIWA